mgnify:FL=1
MSNTVSTDYREFVGKSIVIVEACYNVADSFIPTDGRNIHVGAACARLFSERGANVTILDPSSKVLEELKAEIEVFEGEINTIVADCADPEDLKRAAGSIQGPVNALVNCHSNPITGSLENLDFDRLEEAVRGDLLGPLFATKSFLPHLKKADDSSVTHIGSIDGILGNPHIPSYSMCKGGLIPLTHVMADEFSKYGIRVNCVARAMIVDKGDPIHENYTPLVEQTPTKRPAYPKEVAEAVYFIASSAASYINGVTLPVDGGRIGITPGTKL